MKKGISVRKSPRQLQLSKLRLVGTGIAIFGAACFVLIIYMNFGIQDNAKAEPGKDGSLTVSTTNRIVNEFTTLTSNASSGSTQLTVSNNNLNSNNRFAGPLACGDLVLIIQMRGASIDNSNSSGYGAVSAYNNSGKYELAEVSGVSSSNKINLSACLKNSYTASGKVQVVRVPRYTTLTIDAGASLTTSAWNGSYGGVLVMEVNSSAVINGTIDVSGKGFRGGNVEQSSSFPGNHSTWRSSNTNDGAEKGESIAGDWSTYDGLNGRYGRGAPANGGGGGNAHNAGGGGGANGGSVAAWTGKGNPDLNDPSWLAIWNLEGGSFGTTTSSGGGRGGYSYSATAANPAIKGPNDAAWGGDYRYNIGGYGGRPLDYSSGRIFMGGGGGSGDSNNGKGTSGGAGGGIVLITCGASVSGSGIILSDGASVPTTSLPGNDACGGGGGGGSIVIYTRGGQVSNLTLMARGGNGGSQNISMNEGQGPGGGGGGGFIAVTASSALITSVVSGQMGLTNSPQMPLFTANGGTKGSSGSIGSPPSNPYSTVSGLPVELISFEAKYENHHALITWETASEKNNDYFTIERSSDAKNFEAIGKVEGAGNSSSANDYSYKDYRIPKGVSYYRLMQTDFDGKFEYFKIVKVEATENNNNHEEGVKVISIGPNPFKEFFSAEIEPYQSGNLEMQIMALNGRIVHRELIETSGGTTVYRFYDNKNLQPGIYFFRVMQDGKISKAQKLIKN